MGRIRRICGIAVITASLFCSSGCATILGGIIGHQSGEMCAGLAIGAAVDFGGCIVNGVGGMFTDKEKQFREQSVLNSEKGEITLPKQAFSVDRSKKLLEQLQDKLIRDGWTCRTTMMKSEYKPKYRLDQRWTCEKGDSRTFEFIAKLHAGHDPEFKVDVPDGSPVDRSAMTIQLHQWMEEVIGGDPPAG